MRRITNKTIQVHFQCVCGNNIVYDDDVMIKWKDLSKARIKRKKDKATGQTWLSLNIVHKQCNCYNEF